VLIWRNEAQNRGLMADIEAIDIVHVELLMFRESLLNTDVNVKGFEAICDGY
jgi:hypothetical protein